MVLWRYRGVGTVGRIGGTVGGDVEQVEAGPWGWYFGGSVGLVPLVGKAGGTVGAEGGTVGLVSWEGRAVPWEVKLCK